MPLGASHFLAKCCLYDCTTHTHTHTHTNTHATCRHASVHQPLAGGHGWLALIQSWVHCTGGEWCHSFDRIGCGIQKTRMLPRCRPHLQDGSGSVPFPLYQPTPLSNRAVCWKATFTGWVGVWCFVCGQTSFCSNPNPNPNPNPLQFPLAIGSHDCWASS
jgi:hypothetical protein